MRTFTYEATDATGQTVRGTIQAASQGDAAQQLAAQGLTVVSIVGSPPGPPNPGGGSAGAAGAAAGSSNAPAHTHLPDLTALLDRLVSRIASFRSLGSHAFAFGVPGGASAPIPGAGQAQPSRPSSGMLERLARRAVEFRTKAAQAFNFTRAPGTRGSAPGPPGTPQPAGISPSTAPQPGMFERLFRRFASGRAQPSPGSGGPPNRGRSAAGIGPTLRNVFGHLAARLSTPEAAGAGRAIGHSIGDAAMRLFPAFRKVADESRRLAESFADVRRKSNWLNERNPSHQSLLGRLNELSRDRLTSGRHRQQAADAAAHLHATVTRAGQLGRRAGQARRTADRLAQQAAERQRIAGDATQRAGRLRHAMRRAGQRLRGASTMHRAARTHLQHAGAVFQRAQQRRQAVVTARHQMANARQGLQAAQLTGNPQQIAAARQQFQQARQQFQQARAQFNPQHFRQANIQFRRAHQRANQATRARRYAAQRFGTARSRFQQGAATAGRHHAAATTAAQRAAHGMQQFQNLRNRARGMGARAQAARRTATTLARGFTVSSRAAASIMALGRAGGLVGTVFAALAAVTVTAIAKLKDFAERVNQSNRYLVAYNGNIARSFAQLDINQVRRNIKTGFATEQTVIKLTHSVDHMRESWSKFDRSSSNIRNLIAAKGADIAGFAGAAVGNQAEILERFVRAAIAIEEKIVGAISQGLKPVADLWNAYFSVLNKILDNLGLPKAGQPGQAGIGAWEDFLVGARDGRFGGPLNRPRMNRRGQAVIGGGGFGQVVPGRPQGRGAGQPFRRGRRPGVMP